MIIKTFEAKFTIYLFWFLNSIAYSSISVVGIVGNVAVFIVVTKSPQMRTLTNKFIGNLALADLLVNVLCVPFTLVSNLYPGKILFFYKSPKCTFLLLNKSDELIYCLFTFNRKFIITWIFHTVKFVIFKVCGVNLFIKKTFKTQMSLLKIIWIENE